ncbi:winged helix-turn-helix domain-containing protein [Natronoflexus pectinivorans]|uniref:Molybdate transport system regulatory protein n=1 Tax=Natronoflexus pectinivorans TaxID=682526 RepID=A0A4R2GFY6_9BACT|nr:winged helix-turn-helix domain-containing protein [Natronoflexus pectinivorans]TCO07140.1 molybdate transport system regulatory protein [Natronoflexus pectinivorans]
MVDIQCNINIKRNGVAFLSNSKTSLLQEIASHGSLSGAAKHLSISYQHAWNMIDEMNRVAPEPLVAKQRGGANGGGAVLTPYGKRILKEFQYIESHIKSLIKKLNTEIAF